jgi:hypothetical protein
MVKKGNKKFQWGSNDVKITPPKKKRNSKKTVKK